MKIRLISPLILLLLIFSRKSFGQPAFQKSDLQIIYEVPHTSVKNQSKTSTCWSFATLSFLESEMLRTTGKEYDFSEMFIVRSVYQQKAENYVRMHGNTNFSPGGEASDVMQTISKIGMVTENVYDGLPDSSTSHKHSELDNKLSSYIEAIVDGNQSKAKKDWITGFQSILDQQLGIVPGNFTYNGEQFSASTFAASLNIDPTNYVYLTSFTHHPFYQSFVLEIPDNWSWWSYFNFPLSEMVKTIDYALENGYSVTWSADYSEPCYLHKYGIAVVPEFIYSLPDEEFQNFTLSEKDLAKVTDLKNPVYEVEVTQELRQEGFDDQTTTDDHLMHIVGLARGKAGKKYYLVKNSWGTNSIFEGYFFVSEEYFKYKTIFIMLNKEGVPKKLLEKM